MENIQWLSVAIFAVGCVMLRKWKLDPILVMVASGVAGLVLYSLV